jgi:hypothetical protein
VKLTVLEPLAIESGLAGLNVTAPLEELDKLTLIVASAVFGLLNWSCRWTVIVPEVTPAVTVTGEVVKTSLVAVAAFTVKVGVLVTDKTGPVTLAVRDFPLPA